MLFDGLIQRERIDIEFRFFECLFEVFIYQFICQLFLIPGFLDFGKFCNFEPAQYRLIKLKLKISLARMLGNFFCICNIKQISSRIIFSNICARKLHSRLNGRKRKWILLEVTLHLINNCISFLDRWQRKKKIEYFFSINQNRIILYQRNIKDTKEQFEESGLYTKFKPFAKIIVKDRSIRRETYPFRKRGRKIGQNYFFTNF